MTIGKLAVFFDKKTILLAVVFFASLFFGSEVLAAACSLDDWNVNDCEITIGYTDPGGGSGLAECKYRVTTNAGGDTGLIIRSCSGGTATIVLQVAVIPGTVIITEAGYSPITLDINSDRSALTVYSEAEDTAGNTGSQSKSFDVCTGCLINNHCYSDGEVKPANGCKICDRNNSKTSWSNVPDNQDPAGVCAPSWTSCDSVCAKRGGDGFCDGTGSCDTNDATSYITTAGRVCSGGGEISPSASNYCDRTINCTDNDCSAERFYRGCAVGGTSCVETGKVSYTAWNATQNYLISETTYKVGNSCSQDQLGYCGESDYTSCSPNKCQREKELYRCNGSGSCTYKSADSLENCGANTACSGGSCASVNYCSDTDHCSGDTYYTGYTCDGDNYCNVDKDDIGCCQSLKCLEGYYCQESTHSCQSLPECKTRNETGFGYSNADDGADCSGTPGKCCSGACDSDGVIANADYHSQCRSDPSCLAVGNWGYAVANNGSWCGSPWEICYDSDSCDIRTIQYQCASGYCNNAQQKSSGCTDCTACNEENCGSLDCAVDVCSGVTTYYDYPVYNSSDRDSCTKTCSGEACQVCSTDSDECLPNSETCSADKECNSATNNCAGLTTLKCHRTNAGNWYWEAPPFSAETACSDDYDNDCDGLVDSADPDCCLLNGQNCTPTGTPCCSSNCLDGPSVSPNSICCPSGNNCVVEESCRNSIAKSCTADDASDNSISELGDAINDYWCTYNEHDGCGYVKAGVQLVNGQSNPDFWEGESCGGDGGSSSLYGEKKVYVDNISKYTIKARVYIDDNSWVWINGSEVSGLHRNCCGYTDWVDVNFYFDSGWNLLQFKAEDGCSGGRYFDLAWDVCLTNFQSCSSDGDCCSDHCAEDYDGSGKWCMPQNSCAHNEAEYPNGAIALDCYSLEERRYCNSGTWTSEDCGTEYWQCCDSGCGRQFMDYGCTSGSCWGPAAGACQDCGAFTCSAGECTTVCSQVCGAECDEDTDCSCPSDGCVGNDWYNYPDNAPCSSCSCQSCEPTILPNDARCDTEEPVVTDFDVSPKSPSWLNNSVPTATISWQVSDSGDSHLSHVEVWRTVDAGGAPDGGQWQQIGSNYNAPADSDSWTSNTTDSPSNGIYWYGIHVLDKAGNMGYEPFPPGPIKVLVDKTNPPKPTCSPGNSNFVDSITVTCSCTESGVTIRYTTDGSAPTLASNQYTDPLIFTLSTTLKIASWDTAGNRSSVSDNSYTYIKKDCEPESTRTQSCGSGDCVGTQGQTCQSDWTWPDTWSDCSSSGDLCGTDTGSCDDYCSGLSLVEYDSPTDCLDDSTSISCDKYCSAAGSCQECTLPDCSTPTTHCCVGVCGAECDEDTDCACDTDGCVGADWYNYPDNGSCSSCACDTGTGTGQPCEPTVISNDSRCDTENPVVDSFDVFPKSPSWVNNSTPNATIDWTVTDSGDSHLSHVEVWRTVDAGGAPDGGQWQQIGSNYNAPADSDSWTSNTTDSPSNGIYWYGIHVLDKAGNMGTELTPIRVLVDKTNPSSAVTDPIAGSWHNNDFSATLDDSDAGGSGLASNCQYLIVGYNPDSGGDDCSSGVLSRGCDLANVNVPVGSGSCSVNNICVFEGQNRCRVNTQSFDKAGNNSGWQSRNFSIDYSAPIVDGVSPKTAIKNEVTTFSASATDTASQITGCWFYEGTTLISAGVDFSDIPCTECTISVDYAFDTIGDHEEVYFMCQDSAQNYGTGSPVTVNVDPPPTLAVDLTADPGTGVIKTDYSGLEEPIDLTATVSGTMEGTINYKFDCTNNEGWELEINDSSVNPYTAVDVCDYTTTGLYTAKVFIERGDGCGGTVECTDAYLAANPDDFCCQEDIIEISVEENQPPICSIGVPVRITPSANIYIDVSGSSDPEGALTDTRFSSDNNLNGSADGSWNPVPPNYYDWNSSSGAWDATDKEMKWSFAEVDTYEVWAEVKDDVGQSDFCYGTIIVSECIPGSTKSCTSLQGCLHTLTCTTGGVWPSCPTDECTPEDAQNCGVAGTQICSDSCAWGTCVEPNPECSETPPSCPVCQYPECIAPNWECQPDAAGIDCGDCRECNGSGSCTYVCSGVESSCECITDACVDCSNYYDSTGPTYGYRGICNCGALEIPLWDCDNGNCICTCWNPEGGDPPPYDPPDPIPDPPPSPPPGDPCEENTPTAVIDPFSQAGNAGEALSYDVFVLNNDSLNCDSSTFDLTTGGICNEIGWSCSVLPDLTIPAGESRITALTVTSPSTYSRGNYQFSVTADSTTTQAIYQFANNSPSVQNLSVDSHNPTDYCFVAGYPPLRVRWEFVDPDLPEDNQSAYEIEVSQGGAKVVDTGKQICQTCRSSLFTALSFGATYTWQIRVWDSSDVVSNWVSGPTFSTIAHSYPWPDFNWNPEAPTAGEIIQFEDLTTFYNGFGIWEWDFDGDGITDSTIRNATTSYSEENPEGYEVSLKVKDGSNYGPCATEQNVSVRKPLPEWQEVPPF